MFGEIHFIFYINISIATKVDSYIVLLTNSTQRISVVASGK